MSGETIDISEWLDFGFYDRVWYWDQKKMDMTEEQAKIGRWLGIAHRVGSDMTYWVLTESGKVIARSTVQHITTVDMSTDAMKACVATFDDNLLTWLDDKNFQIALPSHVLYLQDKEEATEADVHAILPNAHYRDMLQDPKSNADDIEFETFDQYLGANFLVKSNGETAMAKVSKRVKDNDGNPIGKRNVNPLLDTREFECTLEDRSAYCYNANVIADNIFSQCDDEGRRHAVLQEITDHKSNRTAVHITNGYTTTRKGRQIPKTTTKGWKVVCQWRDGSSDWIDLKHVKDSTGICGGQSYSGGACFQMVVGRDPPDSEPYDRKSEKQILEDEPEVCCQVATFRERGIADRQGTGTDFWWKAIQRETKKVMIAFELDEGSTPEQVRQDKSAYVAFQEIACHMIFDVKMDLTRKARFVAGGHLTDNPASITYSSVVSRDSVRIAFLIAALNDLDIMARNVGNAYLNAPCREKVWFVAGPEFCSREGTVVKVVRALYGLKLSGAAWRAMFNATVLEMGFVPTIADPDVYRKPSVKENGFKYYEYILVYVDDVLIISHNTAIHLEAIQAQYEFNPASIGPPSRYLGADVRKVTRPGDPTGRKYWSLSANTCVKIMLQADGRYLKSTAKSPFSSTANRPETDTTDE